MGVIANIDEIVQRAESATLAPDVAFAAVFDADGTLWRGDIGDEAFAHALEEGLVTDEAWAKARDFAARYGASLPNEKQRGYPQLVTLVLSQELWRYAQARKETLAGPHHSQEGARLAFEDTFREELYAMQACIYAGHRRSDVVEYGGRLFSRGFAEGVFEEMRRLLVALRARGVELAIVSASHGALVEAGAAALGVPHVRGMEPAVDAQGVMLPSIEASTYGAGKARAVKDMLGGRRPLFAFGDSVLYTDRQLLESAFFPVAVNTRGPHRAAALDDARMFLLDPK